MYYAGISFLLVADGTVTCAKVDSIECLFVWWWCDWAFR